MRRFLLIIALLCLPRAFAENPTATNTTAIASSQPLAKLSVLDAAILGLVEGVSEFLPISSTGHLIIVTDWLGLDNAYTLSDESGQPLWFRKPKGSDPGELLTPSLANQAYIVVIQFGAIAAIIPICWPQLLGMTRGIMGRDPRGRRLLLNVIIAFLPSAVLGLLIHDWIDENFYSRGTVIFALAFGAIFMFIADRWGRRLQGGTSTTDLTPHGAVWIGFMQCLALCPGASRPMVTIVGGYLVGLPPGPAAGFSFLLGLVTLTAATLYKSYKSGPLIIEIFGWQSVIIGMVVAGVTAWFSVRFFIRLLLQRGLSPFAWYRLALAALLLFVV